MSDLIKREDVDNAIQRICDLCGEDKKNNGIMCGACNLDSFIRDYENLPSAEPERKKGEWVEYPDCLRYEDAYADDQIVCSECHHVFNILDNCTEEFDFCPHCGADMRGE